MKIEIKDLIYVEEVLEALEKLPDYRRVEEKIEYSYRDVLFAVLCSMFAGNSEMTEMYDWLELNYNTYSFKVLIKKGS